MIVYPAIDVRQGRCVRLVEGDFARETRYDADPVDAARRWVEAGASWLHVVDLDGAVAGRPMNQPAITRIRDAVSVPMQLGGGLRTIEDLETVFAAGIDRAILGTAVLRDPTAVTEAITRWGEAIAIALDARDGRLATDGWLGQSETEAVDAARDLCDQGAQRFILTDIRRDGTLSGPNLASLGDLARSVSAEVIASGGMATIEDLRAAAGVGAGGAIVGRALYDGRIDLAEAIAAVEALENRP